MRLLPYLLLVAGCVPTPSESYQCAEDSDCRGGRVCSATKYCVIASGENPDAEVTSDAPVDADPFGPTRAACMAAGYVVEPTTGGLVRSVATTLSWANAEADCADDVVGATHLMVLSSLGEIEYAKSQLGWLGFTDAATEGVWSNVTGDTAVYTPLPWLPGQPDNGGGNEDCARMKVDGLDDDQCGSRHRYICECDGRAPIL